MLFYTDDVCDGEADVEATSANEGCININRHHYSYKISFIPKAKKTIKNNGYFGVKCDKKKGFDILV